MIMLVTMLLSTEKRQGSQRLHTVDVPQKMPQLALDQLCVGCSVKLLLQGNCQTLYIGVDILHDCTDTLDPDKS